MDDEQNTEGIPVCVGLVYGEAKRAKTSSLLGSFPNALWIGVDEAITTVAQVEYGYDPIVLDGAPPETIPELLDILDELAEEGDLDYYTTVCIDDLSPLAQGTVDDYVASGTDGRRAFGNLDRDLRRLLRKARYYGVNVIANAWERAAGVDNDSNHVPGGPEVGSRNQIKKIPGWFDVVVRASADRHYPDPWLPISWFCDPHSKAWKTSDRCHVAHLRSPPSFRALLQCSHTEYVLERLPGCEWQDDVAEDVAEQLAAGTVVKDLVTACWRDRFGTEPPAVPSTDDEKHFRWAIQDGIALHVTRLDMARPLFGASKKSRRSKQ